MLNMPGDIILGMLWLQMTNPCIEWTNGSVAVEQHGRLYEILAVFGAGVQAAWVQLKITL